MIMVFIESNFWISRGRQVANRTRRDRSKNRLSRKIRRKIIKPVALTAGRKGRSTEKKKNKNAERENLKRKIKFFFFFTLFYQHINITSKRSVYSFYVRPADDRPQSFYFGIRSRCDATRCLIANFIHRNPR